MPVVKISVSIEAADLAWAKKRAKREKASLSAVVSRALQEQRRMEALDDVLAAMRKHHPPATQAELDAIRAEQEGRDVRADVRHGRADRDRALVRKPRRAARDARDRVRSSS